MNKQYDSLVASAIVSPRTGGSGLVLGGTLSSSHGQCSRSVTGDQTERVVNDCDRYEFGREIYSLSTRLGRHPFSHLSQTLDSQRLRSPLIPAATPFAQPRAIPSNIIPALSEMGLYLPTSLFIKHEGRSKYDNTGTIFQAKSEYVHHYMSAAGL